MRPQELLVARWEHSRSKEDRECKVASRVRPAWSSMSIRGKHLPRDYHTQLNDTEMGLTNFRRFVHPHMSCFWRTTGVESLPLIEQHYILRPDTLNFLRDGFE